jgi:hypothetical protein
MVSALSVLPHYAEGPDGWQATHPLASFKLPFGKITRPMGEAPERLLTYLKLSRTAKTVGSRYWQLRSPIAARMSINFFPSIPKDQDLATFDAGSFMTDAWWAQVEASAETDSEIQRNYFNSVREESA